MMRRTAVSLAHAARGAVARSTFAPQRSLRQFGSAVRSAAPNAATPSAHMTLRSCAVPVLGACTAAVAATAVVAGCSGGVTTIFQLSDVDTMLANADKYSRQATYDKLRAMDERDPENPKVMWRLARASYELSGETKDKVEAKRLMEEAYSIIKQAVELDKTDSDIHRWCGNILNGLSAFISTKESIANSYRIRSHWEDAISVNPDDATAKALLGRWAYEVASLSWIKRNIAKALFGTPPTATYEEALEFMESAERTDPGFWMMNRVTIAKAHYQLSHKEEAMSWAMKALELPARSQDDKKAAEEAEALIKKLGGTPPARK